MYNRVQYSPKKPSICVFFFKYDFFPAYNDTLISISKKLNELNVTKKICLNDTTGWYSFVLQNFSRAIAGKSVDLKSPAGQYAQEIMDRHPEMVM
jgi:hypothetical protein